MDEQRFQTLLKKREETGLNDGEADELGRMFAEREGDDYSNAEKTPTDEAQEKNEAAEMQTRVRDESVEEEVRDQELGEDRTSTNPA
jgi:hypothetical protein